MGCGLPIEERLSYTQELRGYNPSGVASQLN